jgi:hypothetical protein
MIPRRALVVGTILVGVGTAVALLARTLPLQAGGESQARPVAFPLIELQVTQHLSAKPEIYAELHPRVQLGDVLAMDILDGFAAGLSPERALERHGEPAGRWIDPIWGSDSPYYERPLARISLGQFHGSNGKPGWKTVAYPRRTSLPRVIVNDQLRSQIVAALPEAGQADVVIARPIGSGRVELFMTREDCRAVMWLEEGS